MRYILALLLVFTASSAFAALKTNDTAPNFTLNDQGGKPHSLKQFTASGNAVGKGGVVLSFFASWCSLCREELPILDSLVNELAGKGITIVLIAVREDFDRVGPLLKQLKVDKPVVLSDRDGKVTKQYQVRYLPTTFFIKSDGSIQDIIVGEIEDQAEVRRSVEKMRQ
jgi:thiol-disulfide isomerase/thioredoxin